MLRACGGAEEACRSDRQRRLHCSCRDQRGFAQQKTDVVVAVKSRTSATESRANYVRRDGGQPSQNQCFSTGLRLLLPCFRQQKCLKEQKKPESGSLPWPVCQPTRTFGTGLHDLSREVLIYLRWRIFARILRFFRPILRRPLPVFLVPMQITSLLAAGEFRYSPKV